ncbi:hypothetical protein WJX77_007527 [Trebouxia sp. C0004]
MPSVPRPNVLSVDVVPTSLGYAIYSPSRRRFLAWGVKTITLQNSSYMQSVIAFEDHYCSNHSFQIVVIERQLRHLDLQMGRIEANLEGSFRAKGNVVVMMAAGTKYSSHGLQLPQSLEDRFSNWTAAALLRAVTVTGILSKSQQTRLNKKEAKATADLFLEITSQPAAIQIAYDTADKQDDMADAVLQALAYAKIMPGLSPHRPQVIVID